MEREQIIRMAREAGFSSAVGKHIALDEELERFAALVAAAEREVILQMSRDLTFGSSHKGGEAFKLFAALVAAAEREVILQMSRDQWFKTQTDFENAIRARGNT